MTFQCKEGAGEQLLSAIASDLNIQGLDPEALVGAGELPVFEKYDDCIPPELLRQAYAADRLSPDEVIRRFGSENGGWLDV